MTIRCGIFGPTLSGKTTLAKVISQNYWTKHKIRTLVLDINGEYGGLPYVTAPSDESVFWNIVWNAQGCLVMVDEASTTINRDKTLTPVFTRLRHLNHHLIVIGHNGTNLLPGMREALNVLYLFRQPKKSAEIWAFTFADDRILEASQLNQYEYLYCEMYKTPRRQKLKL